jgi:hypothetical protein
MARRLFDIVLDGCSTRLFDMLFGSNPRSGKECWDMATLTREETAATRVLLKKVLGWCVFVVGTAIAVIGIGDLLVEPAVAGVIAATTSGLVLLSLRAV